MPNQSNLPRLDVQFSLDDTEYFGTDEWNEIHMTATLLGDVIWDKSVTPAALVVDRVIRGVVGGIPDAAPDDEADDPLDEVDDPDGSATLSGHLVTFANLRFTNDSGPTVDPIRHLDGATGWNFQVWTESGGIHKKIETIINQTVTLDAEGLIGNTNSITGAPIAEVLSTGTPSIVDITEVLPINTPGSALTVDVAALIAGQAAQDVAINANQLAIPADWINLAHDPRFALDTDPAAAINDAIILAAAEDRPVYLPGGVYHLNAPINYLSSVSIKGAGSINTILQTTAAKGLANGQSARCYNNEFADFRLVFVGADPTGTIGFDWDSVSTANARNIKVEGFETGWFVSGTTASGASSSLYNSFWNCHVSGCTTGVQVIDQSNSNSWTDCTFLLNEVGCHLIRANNAVFSSTAFEANTTMGLLVDPTNANWVTSLTLMGCRFEGASQWHLKTGTARTSFFGNHYAGGGATPTLDEGVNTHRIETPLTFFGGLGTINLLPVVGSRNNNDALGHLLFQLDKLGLIDNQTTPT